MVDTVAASGLLTATSVMVVGLAFVFDRVKVPREKQAKRTLFVFMAVGYLSSLWCLFAVTLPDTPISPLFPAEMLFTLAIVSMTGFLFMMGVALFPGAARGIVE